jgi:protein O-mannosyl-transferase
MVALKSPFNFLILVSLLVVTAGLYSHGLSGSFIFDDGPALTANSYLEIDGKVFDDWRTASLSSASGPFRRPVAMLSFTANYVVSGDVSPFFMKAFNLLIHLICGGLVYLFAAAVLRRGALGVSPQQVDRIAILATLLWLLAPLHVSTVLYVVQRMAQLSTLFSLAGLVIFITRREKWAQHGASTGELINTSLWLMLLYLLAILSKENGLTLVWLLAVVEVTLYHGQWRGGKSTWLQRLGWLAFLLPLILAGVILLTVPEIVVGGYGGRDFSLEERLLTQGRLLWQYISWMVLPDINDMGFQHDDMPLSRSWLVPLSTLIALIGWLCAAFLAYSLRLRYPLLAFSLAFYLVAHFLESGLWPLEMVYEHRNYLPSVGVYIALAYLLSLLLEKQRLVRPLIAMLVIAAMLSTSLFLRVHAWAEPIRLSAVNVKNHPESSRSHYFMAESWLHAYRAIKDNGQNSDEAKNYLVLARHEFELMHDANPRDMAAIVMLFYMDHHFFPQLQGYDDWLVVLEQLVLDRPLQISDYHALEGLLDCVEAAICPVSEVRLFGLLNSLKQRYPNSTRLELLEYRYLKSTMAPLSSRIGLLEKLLEKDPWDALVYQNLLSEHAASGNITGLYESVMAWMAHDPRRLHLGSMRKMFAEPDQVLPTAASNSVAPSL